MSSPAKQKKYNSLCKEFNSGNCSRMATFDKQANSCQLSQGVRLLHLCNLSKTDGSLCLAEHPSVRHYTTPTKLGAQPPKSRWFF